MFQTTNQQGNSSLTPRKDPKSIRNQVSNEAGAHDQNRGLLPEKEFTESRRPAAGPAQSNTYTYTRIYIYIYIYTYIDINIYYMYMYMYTYMHMYIYIYVNMYM